MKVSIVVPLYNKEKYIEKCINSIINQTLKEIEIIIVNDGSSDGSIEIVKKMQEVDSRIKLFSKSNGGLSSARNYGIHKATGKYIGFVDGDDTVSENMFEILYNIAEKEISDITMCSYCFVKEDKILLDNRLDFINKINITGNQSSKIIRNILKMKIDTGVCLKLFKLDLLKNNNIYFDEKLKLSEDYPFTIKAYLKSKNNYFINEQLYNYMLDDEQSLSRSYDNSKIEKIIDVYNKIVKITTDADLDFDSEIRLWLINNIRFMTSLACKKYNGNYKVMRSELNAISSNQELIKILNILTYKDIIRLEDKIKLKLSNSILLLLLKHNAMNIYCLLRKINNIIC